MLDREHIVPTPIVENHQPLDILIENLAISQGKELSQGLDSILCVSRQFTAEQMSRMDRIVADLHNNNREEWFYQRIFELALKMYGFGNDWRNRLRMCKLHEKHRFRIHSNIHEFSYTGGISEIPRICKAFMQRRKVVYDRVNVLGYCVLEISGMNGEAGYEGEDDIFYLIEYVYRRDLKTLLRWAKNVRVMNDWSLLYLTNYPDFLYTEMRYQSNPMIIKEIVIQQKSHRLYNFLFVKLSMLFPKEEMANILIKSYKAPGTEHTTHIFHKLFEDDEAWGEKMLKRFIRSTGAKELGEMFFERCKQVDGDYAEVLCICIEKAHLIKDDCLERLMNSHYWPHVTHRYEDFSILMKLLIERDLSPQKEYDFLESGADATLENLRKILFMAREMPLRREDVRNAVVETIRRMFKKRMACERCREKKIEKSLRLCPVRSLIKRESGMEEDKGLLIMYEILETLRGLDIPKRTLYMLSLMNSDLFCRTVINDTRYDCFFIKCMNIILRDLEGRFRHMINDVVRMRIFDSDGYWEQSVRKCLKLRSLWKAVISFGDLQGKGSGCGEHKKNGLYSLRNIVIHSDSSFLVENECSSETVERNGWSLLEDKRNLRYMKILDDKTRLKYLIKELEGRRDPESLGMVTSLLKESCSVADGMVFKDSSILFKAPSKAFTLHLSFGQYDEMGEQVFVQLEGKEEVLKIGRTNGKLFMKKVGGMGILDVLLSEDSRPKMDEVFRSSYKSSKFSFCLNGRMYSSKIGNVEKIRIGVGFRGVVEKIFLCESNLPRKYVLGSGRQSSMYVDELSKIERFLEYKSLCGVYMDSTTPYFISGKLYVKVSNVIDNRNVYWMCNRKVESLLRDGKVKLPGLRA
ncbi:hypothetical protein EHEL_060580 [Encephalitozoon hellem ATCC 50504]|uniref:Uncharacterized protein n=1 Tax=Encephalitozoon hellem TaxID=27973 RepID=A0A9Q9C8D1_ENCHE|nr:uncharacterized protein EHEL_060580 [Encephalitozoon hellem ATCC 50504]AFM98431.1 hypothetical protein EHEL_060580 [Encephalitozoon hellem ATCC 50504]UTX43355.1 hypothetical protein GPU96_06g11020 [Encephalitozoon hellem]WEL38818.1 hypothetical protein PFJ87_06g00840 [Encephalitozoon hellem]|eukprot:XP_003887412.1 hypothetical protein EHEL_060580 [Encephalitozoon hellem ATCC 50504]